MAETDRTIIVHGWPYDERSTRNCLHCKTCMANGKAKAYCKYNHLFEEAYTDHNPDYEDIYRYAMSLAAVLECSTWASTVCNGCPLFEHDMPLSPAECGRLGYEALERQHGMEYMRERVAGARAARNIPPAYGRRLFERDYTRIYMREYRQGKRRRNNGQGMPK